MDRLAPSAGGGMMMNNNELIQQARELCEKRLTGINKYHGSIATKSSRCGDGVYDSIIERLYHFEYDIVPQLCDALEAMTTRAEKAEAERDTYKTALQALHIN